MSQSTIVIRGAVRASSPAALFFLCACVQVFQSLFRFLGENWSKLSPAGKKDLRDRPLVPIGTRFIKARRLFFRLKVRWMGGGGWCKHQWVRFVLSDEYIL